MRATLTWETHARGRSAAAVYERGALALALALPVPLLAAAGLSLPLPDSVFRLGILAAQRTALIADALPGVGRDRPAEKAVPVVLHVKRATHVAPAHAAMRTPARPAAAPKPAVPRRHRSRRAAAGTSGQVVTRPKLTPTPALASRGQNDPTTDPVTTTPTTTTTTPAAPVAPTTDSGATPVTPAASSSAAKPGKPVKASEDQQPTQDSTPQPTTDPATTTPVTTTTPTPTKGQGQGKNDPPGTTTTPSSSGNGGKGSSGKKNDAPTTTTTVPASG